MNASAWRAAESEMKNAPANLEAEQCVLGALLFDNDSIHAVEGLEARHFFEPFHGALFEAISGHARRGRLADPVTLAGELETHPAFREMGGADYLADLVDHAPPVKNLPDYVRVVVDVHQRRELIRLSGDVAQTLRREQDVPVAEVIGQIEATLLALQAGDREVKAVTAAHAAARVIEQLEQPEAADGGIITGLAPLDQLTGPLLPGDLLLLMGRPSMGKSAAAECIAMNMAEPSLADLPPVGVIQVNGEMSAEQMARRHMTDLCFNRWGERGPKYSDIRKREITADQLDMLRWAQKQLVGMPLVMLKRTGIKVATLRSIARRQAAEWARAGIPLGALIVDHVGLLRPDERMRDRYEAQTAISNAMKELADELGCVVIGLNQMNRENEKRTDKRPQLSDLRDSGSWEQDADFVVGFYREAYYAQREAEPKAGMYSDEWNDWDRRRRSRTIEAIVLKAREGECGTAELWGDVARNAIRGSAPADGGRPW